MNTSASPKLPSSIARISRNIHRTRFALILGMATAALPSSALADRELEALKNQTDRWIDIKSRLAEADNEWKEDKVILASSIETLTHSLNAVNESVEYYESENRELQRKLEEADQRLQSFDHSNEALRSHVTEYEKRLQALLPRLPDPLRDRVDALARRIPSDSTAATDQLPNRLQNVVAIMSLIDEFNKNLTLAHAIRTTEEGDAVEVRILYWGLAGAYASSPDGSRAWTLQPAADEWSWQPASEPYTSAIRSLFAVYDKSIDPIAVSAPFTLIQSTEQP